MSEPILSPESLPSLRALLARADGLSLDQTLAFLQQLVHVVQSLHAAGQIHRGISLETVLVDDTSRVVLAQAEPLRMLNGADLDTSPPELQSARTLRLPIRIDDCRRALEDAGVRLDPRRIDVYQIGVVLCRLLTQTTVAAYLRSPRVKSGVPPRVRPLLERALGYQAAKRLADAGQLAAVLGEVLDPEPVDVMPATPLPEGSFSATQNVHQAIRLSPT